MPCARIRQGDPIPGPAYDTPEECVSCRECTQNENCCRCRGRILWRCDMAQECRNLGGIFDDFDNVCNLGGEVYGDCLGLVLDDPQCQGGGQGPTLTMPPYCRAHVESLIPKGANLSSSFHSYGGFCCNNLCSDTPCCPQERICNDTCCPEGEVCLDGACCPQERICNDTCCPEGYYCKDGTCLTEKYYCVPPPTKYACDGNGNCSENPNGQYTTIEECRANCCSPTGACPQGYVGSGPVDPNDETKGIICCPETHPFGLGNCNCQDPATGNTTSCTAVYPCPGELWCQAEGFTVGQDGHCRKEDGTFDASIFHYLGKCWFEAPISYPYTGGYGCQKISPWG